MNMVWLWLLFLAQLANCADDNTFDGVGIGIVKRPAHCDRTTRVGDFLRVTFNGSIGDKMVFDTTYMNKPLEFVLGEGQMIPGWDSGLSGMCRGEVRHLTIPPQHAYGSGGLGSLPSRTNLYFFVELLSFEAVKGAPRIDNMFAKMDEDRDGYLTREEISEHLKRSGVKDTQGAGGLSHVLREVFEEEDRDRDGYVEFHEFSGNKFHTEF